MSTNNDSKIKTKTLLDTDTLYDAFLHKQIKLKPNVISGINDISDITSLNKLPDMGNNHWNLVVSNLLKSLGKGSTDNSGYSNQLHYYIS